MRYDKTSKLSDTIFGDAGYIVHSRAAELYPESVSVFGVADVVAAPSILEVGIEFSCPKFDDVFGADAGAVFAEVPAGGARVVTFFAYEPSAMDVEAHDGLGATVRTIVADELRVSGALRQDDVFSVRFFRQCGDKSNRKEGETKAD